jgi:hypothetical protein
VISIPATEQSKTNLSFKGGIPNMPERFPIPHCLQCGAEMTFFFQITFPEKSVWEGKVICFFHCTTCNDAKRYWPMVLYVRDQISIPDNLLDTYQTNFRIYVFDSNEPVILRHEFARRLTFEKLEFEKVNSKSKYSNTTKIGGKPAWDISPLEGNDELYEEITYMGGGVEFLMQTQRDWTFTRLTDTLPQFDYYQEGSPLYNLYRPFMGPKMYFLGTTSPQLNPPRVLMYLM